MQPHHDDLRPLADFLEATADLDDDALAGRIEAECNAGRGQWLRPGAVDWPATTGHQCSILHICAEGDTPAELAAMWRAAARRLLTPAAAA